MKNTFLLVILNLFITNLALGQNRSTDDFMEIGVRISKFIQSSFLEESPYSSQLSDVNTEPIGLTPTNTGSNYAIKFKYGKRMKQKIHWIVEVGSATRDEQVTCFCHLCDKNVENFTLSRVNSFELGTGLRYQLFGRAKFSILVDGIGNIGIAINESNTEYFGYTISPVFQYSLNKTWSFSLKSGFEQTFGDYNKQEILFEIGINYALPK